MSEITFEDMLAIQRDFEENFFDPDNMTMEERQEWLEKFILHAMDQCTSLLNELSWKSHERREPVEYDDVMQELVDIQKYVFAMHVVLNVDPVEFREMFMERSKEVEHRYEAEFED